MPNHFIIPTDRPTDRPTPCCELDDIKLHILHRLAAGCGRKQIAYELNQHPTNIDYHLRRARKALKARTDIQAVVIAIKTGLISP